MNTKYGRKQIRRKVDEDLANRTPERKAKDDFTATIVMVIVIVIILLIVYLVKGTEGVNHSLHLR